MLIVDCHETGAATQAAKYARQAGVPTIIDVERVRPGIGALLQQIDAIIAAQDFPTALTGYDDPGRAIEALAREFDAPMVAVTLGEEGSSGLVRRTHIRTPAFKVDCVDSTGAGDVFRGAFASACLRDPRRRNRGRAQVRQRGRGPQLPGARRPGRHAPARRSRPAAARPAGFVTFYARPV